MLLAKVAGTVVASQKDPGLSGTKMLLLQRLDQECREKDDFVIAVDAVGAGEGEVVLYASGSSARQTTLTKERPIDTVVMAIVDSFSIDGKQIYRK